jgi:hypothetical protein
MALSKRNITMQSKTITMLLKEKRVAYVKTTDVGGRVAKFVDP